MAASASHCRAQAEAMRVAAEAAVLDNVRDRCLGSAEAWTHMAERAERHDAARLKAEAGKATAREEARQHLA